MEGKFDLPVPDEILLNIVMMVSKRDLLQNCRLVNKRWNQLSTEVCRKRFITLKRYSLENHCNGEHKDLYTTFNSPNLPWSGCYITSSYYYNIHIKTRFLTIFGQNIWELNHPLDKYILNVLTQTPNLRRLKVRGEFFQLPAIHDPPIPEINLRRLKHLQMDNLNDATILFFKILVENFSVKLDYFETRLKVTNNTNIEDIPRILKGIGFLSFELDYSGTIFQIMSRKLDCMSVKELCLTLNVVKTNSKWKHTILRDYDTAKKLLTAHSQHLKKLELHITIGSDDIDSIPFDFPVLPYVTAFSIKFHHKPMDILSKFRNGFLSRLQPNQFPQLTSVSVGDLTVFDGGVMPPNTNVIFPQNMRMDSVTELVVRTHCRLGDNWSKIFPNLKRLIIITDIHNHKASETLFSAFSCPTLEMFRMNISLGPGININSLLTGIQNPEDISKKSEINQAEAVRDFPSIVQLSNLKVLSIDLSGIEFGKHTDSINDAGASLSLLLLPPLDELWINQLEVSKECREKLMRRHKFLATPDSQT